ncbi:hypothetical protein ACFWPP_08745 [Streptomyces anulatus]|uniref:hypothetical protein n=1 Tax=Streptomyces anulatus TaxID=1892 RepID=UPI00365116F2
MRETAFYVAVDRAEVIGEARAAGRYDRIRRPLVIADPLRPQVVHAVGRPGRLKLQQLKDVERRRALARGEHLLTMVDAYEHHQMEGPTAVEAARRLDALGQRAGFTGQVVLGPARLKRIMRKHDPAVYPETFITCIHAPAKALCEKTRTSVAERLPEHGGCQPLACQNVALTSVSRDQWQAELPPITYKHPTLTLISLLAYRRPFHDQ